MCESVGHEGETAGLFQARPTGKWEEPGNEAKKCSVLCECRVCVERECSVRM